MLQAPLLKEQPADDSMSRAKASLYQMEDSLRHSRPLRALQAHLSDAQLTDGGSSRAELSVEQCNSIAARARQLAVCSFEQAQVCISVAEFSMQSCQTFIRQGPNEALLHMQIVAACVTLTALCNHSVWPLCIDVAACSSLHSGEPLGLLLDFGSCISCILLMLTAPCHADIGKT